MSKPADDPASSRTGTTAVAKPPVNRRSAGESAYRPRTASDRFWRLFSGREKVIENLKTLAWVIPITLVIWIYAEREQVVNPSGTNVNNIPILIQSDPNRYIEFAGNPDPTVNLKLTGPQQAVDRVRQDLTTNHAQLKIEIPAGLGIGKNLEVTILDRIQDNPEFKNKGVTVQLVVPPTLKVNVDKLGQAKLAVEVPPGITNLSDVTFDPATITVRGPAGELFPKGGPPVRVFADLAGTPPLQKPGKHTIPEVPISLSAPGKLTLDTTKVKADFTVQNADVEGTIDTMPIVLVVSPSLTKAFDIVVNNGVENVYNTRVKGPKNLVDGLVQKSIPAKAELVLEVTDTLPKELVYILPPGVTVDKEDQDRKIDFKLTAR